MARIDRPQHFLLMQINESRVVKGKLSEDSLRLGHQVERPAEQPTVEPTASRALRGFTWDGQDRGGVLITPFEAALAVHYELESLLWIHHSAPLSWELPMPAQAGDNSMSAMDLPIFRAPSNIGVVDNANFLVDERRRAGLDAPHARDRQWRGQVANADLSTGAQGDTWAFVYLISLVLSASYGMNSSLATPPTKRPCRSSVDIASASHFFGCVHLI